MGCFIGCFECDLFIHSKSFSACDQGRIISLGIMESHQRVIIGLSQSTSAMVGEIRFT